MFSDPVRIIEQSEIHPGMDIADFGSGAGQFTLQAAKALMATGRVYAIDVQKDLLSKLKNEAVHQALYNVEIVWGDIEKQNGTQLKDSCVDLVMMCNLLFQLENKDSVIKEAKRILKPGGRILVVEWEDSFGGIGPKPEMVVTKVMAQNLFEKGGFSLDREVAAGSHHYGMIFKKL